MASGVYDVVNGPLEAPGGTSLYFTPCTSTGRLCWCGPLVPPSSPVRIMDTKQTQQKQTENKEGLGSPSGGTQSASETASSKLDPSSRKEETSNPAVGGSGGVGVCSQHTETAVGGQGVLTKTQKRNKRRQQKKKMASQGVNTVSAEGEKEGGTKRLRSEVSTPSPAKTVVSKKQRMVHSRSFAQAVKVVKMAVVKDSFPADKLSNEDFDHIKMEILEKTDLIPSGDHMPKIERSLLHAGAVITYCDDIETSEWIQKIFDGNKEVVEGTTLKVMNASDLPKPIKVAFKTRDTITKEPGLLLRRMNRLNPELKSEEWRVLHKLVETHSIRWIFEVDRDSAEAIKRANYGAYTGLDRGTFKIISDPNVKPKEKEGSPGNQETISQVSDL